MGRLHLPMTSDVYIRFTSGFDILTDVTSRCNVGYKPDVTVGINLLFNRRLRVEYGANISRGLSPRSCILKGTTNTLHQGPSMDRMCARVCDMI